MKNQEVNTIFYDGEDAFRKTDQFQNKAKLIRKRVTRYYRSQMVKEPNFFIKIVLFAKMKISINKSISKIKSKRNLHFHAFRVVDFS